MTPDEKCKAGALLVEGLYVNVGHVGTGFKIPPGLGLCLSELICDGVAKTVDLAPSAGRVSLKQVHMSAKILIRPHGIREEPSD